MFLLVFVLLKVMCCEGCWKQEREALNALNSQLTKEMYYTNMVNALSWTDNTDCCEWLGVECNTTTGRVVKLRIELNTWSYNIGFWHLNYSDFLIFKDLKTLDLSSPKISNCTGTLQGLKNLEALTLSPYTLDNATNILSCLDGLSSLKSLSFVTGFATQATSFHSEAK